MFVGVRVGMDSHNRLRGRGCSGVSARPSDAAWTAVSSLCTPTPTCTSRSYVWFRVRSVMVVAPPVGAVPGGRLARGGPRGPCPAERPCSHSAHLGKKVKDETTTHRGRTRSNNEPIIVHVEGSSTHHTQTAHSAIDSATRPTGARPTSSHIVPPKTME